MRFLRVPGQLTERWLHSRLTIKRSTRDGDRCFRLPLLWVGGHVETAPLRNVALPQSPSHESRAAWMTMSAAPSQDEAALRQHGRNLIGAGKAHWYPLIAAAFGSGPAVNRSHVAPVPRH
jgi:hypothetical protein